MQDVEEVKHGLREALWVLERFLFLKHFCGKDHELRLSHFLFLHNFLLGCVQDH